MIRRLSTRVMAMPPILRTLWGLLALFGPLLFVSTVSPWCQWTYEERPVTYAEFWRSGTGIVMLAISVMMMLFAVGILQAQRWVQAAIPATFVIAALAWFMVNEPVEGAACLSGAAFSYWYLNRKQTTRDYFAASR